MSNAQISTIPQYDMYYSTAWLREGDEVKVLGWKVPKVLIKILDKGAGWLAGLFQSGEEIEYAVIEDWEIVLVGKMEGGREYERAGLS